LTPIFLDASAIIYLLEGEPTIQQTTRQVLTTLASDNDDPALVISTLSLLECRVHPMRSGDETRLGKFNQFFSDPGLTIIELDSRVIEQATRLRAAHGLKTPDALQAASALQLPQPTAFVTGDGDFSKIEDLNVHQIT